MATRYRGTQRSIAAYGPQLFGRLGFGLLVTAGLMAVALGLGRWILVPLAVVVLFFSMYGAAGWLWATYLRYDADGEPPDQIVMRLGGIAPGDQVTVVDWGERHLAIDLSRHLSTGRLSVADIFNPQIFSHAVPARWRSVMPRAVDDPRLDWLTGTYDLLPLRDSSQDAVVLCEILSQIVQKGDQQVLLKEVYRVLRPGGRIIIIEPLGSWLNRVLLGWRARSFRSINDWIRLLQRNEFLRIKPLRVNDVVVYIRGEKLEPMQGIQLTLIRES